MPTASKSPQAYDASSAAQWLICVTCGTQFPTSSRAVQRSCFVCDDPRHFTPPAGQSFTTMATLRASGHQNLFEPYGPSYGPPYGSNTCSPVSPVAVAAVYSARPLPLAPPPPSPSLPPSPSPSSPSASSNLLIDRDHPTSKPRRLWRIPPDCSMEAHRRRLLLPRLQVEPQQRYHPYGAMISIVTEPKFAIGQRAILVHTRAGNILWDCLTLIDDETVARIRALGGLAAIVISHPHFYGAHAAWAAAFDCPVFLAAQDRRWLALESPSHVFLEGERAQEIVVAGVVSGFVAVRLGGHFPGSMVAHFEGRLLVSDTLVTTPAGLGGWDADAAGKARSRPPGMNTFAFMWSIPNAIPLSAVDITRMWDVLKCYDFKSTHGAFLGEDIEDVPDIKARVLESMQIQIYRMGWTYNSLLTESTTSL